MAENNRWCRARAWSGRRCHRGLFGAVLARAGPLAAQMLDMQPPPRWRWLAVGAARDFDVLPGARLRVAPEANLFRLVPALSSARTPALAGRCRRARPVRVPAKV